MKNVLYHINFHGDILTCLQLFAGVPGRLPGKMLP